MQPLAYHGGRHVQRRRQLRCGQPGEAPQGQQLPVALRQALHGAVQGRRILPLQQHALRRGVVGGVGGLLVRQVLLPPLVVDDQVPQHPEQPGAEAYQIVRQGHPRPAEGLLYHVLCQVAAAAQALGVQQRGGVVLPVQLFKNVVVHAASPPSDAMTLQQQMCDTCSIPYRGEEGKPAVPHT